MNGNSNSSSASTTTKELKFATVFSSSLTKPTTTTSSDAVATTMTMNNPSTTTTTNKRVGRKYRKRPAGKPKRPLSAYNIFFAKERQNIVSKQMADSGSTPEEIEKMLKLGGRSQPHRKTHGKIGFLDLAKTIAEKWKNISSEDRSPYLEKAKVEKDKYMKALEEWKLKNPTLVSGSNTSSSNSSSANSTSTIKSLTPKKRKAGAIDSITTAAKIASTSLSSSSSSSSANSSITPSPEPSTSLDLPESNSDSLFSNTTSTSKAPSAAAACESNCAPPSQLLPPLSINSMETNEIHKTHPNIKDNRSTTNIHKRCLPSSQPKNSKYKKSFTTAAAGGGNDVTQLYQQRLSNLMNQQQDYNQWKKQTASSDLSEVLGQCKSMIQKLTTTVLSTVPQQLGTNNANSSKCRCRHCGASAIVGSDGFECYICSCDGDGDVNHNTTTNTTLNHSTTVVDTHHHKNDESNHMIHPIFAAVSPNDNHHHGVTNAWRPGAFSSSSSTTKLSTTANDHLAALVAHRANLMGQSNSTTTNNPNTSNVPQLLRQNPHLVAAASTAPASLPPTTTNHQVQQHPSLGLAKRESLPMQPPAPLSSSLDAKNYMSQIGDLATSLDDDCFDILSHFVAR